MLFFYDFNIKLGFNGRGLNNNNYNINQFFSKKVIILFFIKSYTVKQCTPNSLHIFSEKLSSNGRKNMI